METKTVTVKFGGEVESVDINTFTRVLLDYSQVLQASCKIEDPNAVVTANVRAVRPGCLEVDLGVVAQGIGSLFKDPATSIQTIANGIAIASGFYGLKRFLGKHGKATSAENKAAGDVSIIAEDGASIVVNQGVLNLYTNCPKANDAVSSSFEALDNDPRIDSMSILDKDRTAFHADRSEFGEIANSPAYESPQTKVTEEEATLTVVKPVLERSTTRKWEFLWLGGMKVTACITDKEFVGNLDKHSFTVGTVMLVRMRILKTYSDELKAYVNKRYEVMEVLEVEPPIESPSIF